jgi:hypothetical protein
MNMISTGAFLPEMDASNKQETLAEQFARVWEKKNSKVARAGGVSLMALSLAACGSSSDTTTTTTTPPVVEEEEEEVVEEVVTPVGRTAELDADNNPEFGTAGDDTFTLTATADVAAGTVVADSVTTDNDTLEANVTANLDLSGATTIVGIENLRVNLDAVDTATTGVLTLDASDAGVKNIYLDLLNAFTVVTDVDLTVNNTSSTSTIYLTDEFADIDITVGDADANVAVVAAGDINVSTTAGTDVTVTGSGAVIIADSDSTGDLSITAAGDVTVTDAALAEGTVDVVTVGGDVDLTDVSTADVVVISTDGDITRVVATAATSVTATVTTSL